MNLSIVVPMFNEVENVPRIRDELLPVVEELAKLHVVDVVLVDDGSIDSSREMLDEAFSELGGSNLRFEIMSHEVNRGLGAALRTGFAACSGDVVVGVDSDGPYPFNEIPDLIFLLGTRFRFGDRLALSSKWERGWCTGLSALAQPRLLARLSAAS